MSFATDDLREDILDLFVYEHNKVDQVESVYTDSDLNLYVFDLEQKREKDRKSRILDIAWIRRHDRERKNMQRFKTPETVICPSCKGPMLSFVTNGHPRKYCSDKCRVREKDKRFRSNAKIRS